MVVINFVLEMGNKRKQCGYANIKKLWHMQGKEKGWLLLNILVYK